MHIHCDVTAQGQARTPFLETQDFFNRVLLGFRTPVLFNLLSPQRMCVAASLAVLRCPTPDIEGVEIQVIFRIHLCILNLTAVMGAIRGAW